MDALIKNYISQINFSVDPVSNVCSFDINKKIIKLLE
jgi:hypothetical protein